MALMFTFGISRFDAGAEGIHLAWNAPDVVCLSSPGFDLQRRPFSRTAEFQCALLDSKSLSQLRSRHELATAIGTILWRQGAPLPPIDPATMTTWWPAAATSVDAFTAELVAPTTVVRVAATTPPSTSQASTVFAIAMSAGKAVTAAFGSGNGTMLTLAGSGIDAVVVYVVGALTLTICIALPADPGDSAWATVPYLVKGLTLPIREADPTLATAIAELKAAQVRLVGGEAFSQADFDHLAPTLRMAVSASTLGRAGERILLLRSTTDEPFAELPFSNQLALLQIHPRMRRVLGFGYFDHQSSGLVAGQIYEYRVTGHFDATDLGDTIYDVHTVPSQTTLPARFHIDDLALTFPRPAAVILDPPPAGDVLAAVSRRGILIDGGTPAAGWIGPSLENWSAVIDLPYATATVILETSATHSFRYAGADPWSFTATDIAAPPGPRAKLTFATAVTQVRLRGTGTLFAIRIPGTQLPGVVVADTSPIVYAAQPLPAAPSSLTVSNLQYSGPTFIAAADLQRGPRRPLPGFDLRWLPAPMGSINVWPIAAAGAPPIESIAFQIEHRDVTLPATFGSWQPIQPGDNLVLGTRDNVDPPIGLEFGSDLAELFPLRRARAATAGNAFRLSDVFEVNDSSGTFKRPMPPFGTVHQYRIRALDTVGRTSSVWTESNTARLEKHIPPPMPVGPQPEPPLVMQSDGSSFMSGVPGVKARALIAGDPALSDADRALLGSHQNAVVLAWGWRDSERELDPLSSEFRVYSLHNSPVEIPGTITSVTANAGGWDLAFSTDRVLQADECAGQWVTTAGYPFRIAAHTAGSSIVLHVEAALVDPTATPAVGATQFGRPLRSEHQRPAAWDGRVAVVPLTAAASYMYVFYDLLDLSVNHPRDSVWVGVSAADAESYVADELPAAVINGGRSGNESSVATCVVYGRDHTRPTFSIPPPLGDVPELVSDEPAGRQILISLDLQAWLPGALPAGEPIALDRCPADSIFAITSLNAAQQIQLQMKDGTFQAITFPNPGDEAAVIEYLESAHPERMSTRYLLYLAANHSRPGEIFERVNSDIVAFGTVQDRLAPKPARYFYRVRRADALERVSEGGAILPVVVRVPSVTPAVAPERIALTSTPTEVSITLRVAPDAELSHLLVFATTFPLSSPIRDLSGAELLRTPNRRDLYPQHGIRLRAPGDGALLAPIVKSLSDSDVNIDGDGNRSAVVKLPATQDNWVVLWAYALSQDGIPSLAAGPYTTGVPKS
jgi:hypothetical protein